MLTTIKGVYEKGKIILKEESPVKDKTDVIITFLEEDNNQKVKSKKKTKSAKGKSSKSEEFNDSELQQIASNGGAFDFLNNEEEDIYSDKDLKKKYKK